MGGNGAHRTQPRHSAGAGDQDQLAVPDPVGLVGDLEREVGPVRETNQELGPPDVGVLLGKVKGLARLLADLQLGVYLAEAGLFRVPAAGLVR